MIWPTKTAENQEIHDSLLVEKGVRLFMLRDDLLHPGISGNKWRKLKYNLLDVAQKGIETIVTIGGSHSNHISAVAEAGRVFGFKTIGLIRGYESYRNNPTLQQAANSGMEIRFFDKSEYARIESQYLEILKDEIGGFEYVPMGGGNMLGMKGCVEINDDIPTNTTHITTACGTGSTMAGIIAGAKPEQTILGFPAMKNGAFIKEDVEKYLTDYSATNNSSFEVNTDYHFGGFAKIKPELIDFIIDFYNKYGTALDGIYNGKMMFGVYDLIRKGYFPEGSVITAVHTGGVQGNLGLNQKYKIELPIK